MWCKSNAYSKQFRRIFSKSKSQNLSQISSIKTNFVCPFTVLRPVQEFFTYECGDVKLVGEGLQNLGLCSALRAFGQGGTFIMPHLL
jgi:hypothetical protein